jgi:undecaprenyl-diphosphatase
MNPLEALDQGAHPWFPLLHRPWLDRLMIATTTLGDGGVLAALVALFAAWLLLRRRARSALILSGVALAALALERGVKWLVQRPRPEAARELMPLPSGWSYPSGHALCATAVYVTLALLLTAPPAPRRYRLVALPAALLLAFLIGFSRLYLGVHYVSDVVGGWLAGLACALVGLWLEERGRAGGQSVR